MGVGNEIHWMLTVVVEIGSYLEVAQIGGPLQLMLKVVVDIGIVDVDTAEVGQAHKTSRMDLVVGIAMAKFVPSLGAAAFCLLEEKNGLSSLM